MTARNKLVIVRDADENLQIPLSKKMKVHLTQQMSDQAWLSRSTSIIHTSQLVFNEIATFAADVLGKFQEVPHPIIHRIIMHAHRSSSAKTRSVTYTCSRRHQSRHMIGRRLRHDPVAEVEYERPALHRP